MRFIKSMENKYLDASINLVKEVFTDYENEDEANLVKNLILEIRSKKYYIKELELIMVDELDNVIGYAMFSRFHIQGKYDNELLLLSPVAVKTSLQRQHISKELIEYGFIKARELGYGAVIVEGNPQNYHSRGFETSAKYGIFAHKNVNLPSEECLMVKELKENTLEKIKGYVEYSFYETLK